MSVYDYVVLILVSVAVLIVLIFALRTKKFTRVLLQSCVLGVVSLFILHFLEPIVNFGLQITPFTLGVSSVFGLPGVLCMTIAKMLIF